MVACTEPASRLGLKKEEGFDLCCNEPIQKFRRKAAGVTQSKSSSINVKYEVRNNSKLRK